MKCLAILALQGTVYCSSATLHELTHSPFSHDVCTGMVRQGLHYIEPFPISLFLLVTQILLWDHKLYQFTTVKAPFSISNNTILDKVLQSVYNFNKKIFSSHLDRCFSSFYSFPGILNTRSTVPLTRYVPSRWCNQAHMVFIQSKMQLTHVLYILHTHIHTYVILVDLNYEFNTAVNFC